MISKTLTNREKITAGEQQNGKIPQNVYVIAQEIKIVKSLACNDVRLRLKQLKKLKKWLIIRSDSSFPFSDKDFLRIWKGLFYCMWMSDKPLVQESLADELGSLLKCFKKTSVSARFFGAFLQTMRSEWFGIDQWRMDKFLMLVRRMLRSMFRILNDGKWKSKPLKVLTSQINDSIFAHHEATGLLMHFVDIYLEELAKVSDGNISTDAVTLLVKPFIRFLATQRDYKLLSHLRRQIFYQLLWQSELGREHTERFNAWKEMGFPTESIDDLEKVEGDEEYAENDDESDTELNEVRGGGKAKEKPLDPRAGCVDVDIPEIPVDVEPLIEELEAIQFDDVTNTKSRKVIREILQSYKVFNTGVFPLGVKKMPNVRPAEPMRNLVDLKVHDLNELEDQLLSTTRKLKKLSKKKRKRILQSIDVSDEAITEQNFEKLLEDAIPAKKPKLARKALESPAVNGGWTVEDSEMPANDSKPKSLVELKQKMEKRQKKAKQLASLAIPYKQQHTSISLKQKKLKALKEINAKKLTNGITASETETAVADTTEPIKKKKLKKVKTEYSSPPQETNQIRKSSKDVSSVKKQKKVKSPSTPKATDWNTPLEEGEVEYFVPSRKLQLKKANESLQDADIENSANQSNLVLNPFAKNKAKKEVAKNQLLGKGVKQAQSLKNIPTLSTPGSDKKRVKIVLKKNSAQKASEYIKQVLSSPQVPYDADKKPTKSLLKPNLMPSPINPFYKKKIGLKLNNSV